METVTNLEALMRLHSFLNHPVKSGRLYTTYDKSGAKAAVNVLNDVIKNMLQDGKEGK